jgi:hypothetical protein
MRLSRNSASLCIDERVQKLRKNSIKANVLKGHDFSRAAGDAKSARASAPEGRFSCASFEEWDTLRSLLSRAEEAAA